MSTTRDGTTSMAEVDRDGPDGEADSPVEGVAAAVEPQPSGTADTAPWEVVVVALVALAVGVVLRFTARTPLWLDEALTVDIARLPLGDIPEALRHDGHPPLYYWLLHGWMEVFGQSDAAVRALSGLFGLVTVPLAWLAGRRRGGALLGWVFVAVLAVSPFAVRYSTETRMYSLVILLALAGYLLVDDVVRRGRHGVLRLVGLAVVSGLLLLSHYWALWLLGATALVLAWVAVRDRRHGDIARSNGGWKALGAVVVGGVLGLGWWLPTMLYQSAHTGTPWAAPFRPTTTLSITLIDFNAGSGAFSDSPIIAITAALLFCVGLFGVALDRRHIRLELTTARQFRYEALLIALTIGLGVLAGYASRSAFASRYAAVFFPFFLLIVAGGITRFTSRPLRLGVLAGFCALCLVGAVHQSLLFQRSESRVIAASVAERAKPGDVVLYCPDQLGPSGQREMPAGLRQLSYPRLESPDRVDWVDYATRNAANRPEEVADRLLQQAGDDHSIFVVWSGTYRTLEGQCETLMNELYTKRGTPQDLVTGESERYYESANLKWFPPAGQAAAAGPSTGAGG